MTGHLSALANIPDIILCYMSIIKLGSQRSKCQENYEVYHEKHVESSSTVFTKSASLLFKSSKISLTKYFILSDNSPARITKITMITR